MTETRKTKEEEDVETHSDCNGKIQEAVFTTYGPLPMKHVEAAKKSVCRISMQVVEGHERNPKIKTASGFLVRLQLGDQGDIPGLLTNNHVISEHDFYSNVPCQLEFESLGSTPFLMEFRTCRYFFTSRHLDATFIGLSEELVLTLEEQSPTWLTNVSETRVKHGIFIIHHPSQMSNGDAHISIGSVIERPSDIDSNPEHDFYYKLATERGSSGSPVVNFNGELVGLHYSSFDKVCNVAKRATWLQRVIIEDYMKRSDMMNAMQVTSDNGIRRSSNQMERSRKRKHATTGMDEDEEDSMCRAKRMKILEQNEETLLRTMDCNVVVMANLASENILETEHQQEIEAEIIPIKKNRKLLKKLSGCSREKYEKVVKVFKEERQEHVANMLAGHSDEGKRPLTADTYKRLKKNKHLLIKAIKWTENIFIEIQNKNILIETDLENIESKPTPSEKKVALIDAIMKRSEEDLQILKQIFERAGQENVAQLLYEDDASIAKHLVVSSNVTQHGEEDISRELHSKSLLEDQGSSKSGEQSIAFVVSDPGGSIIVHFYVETTSAAEFCLMHIKDGKLKDVLEGVICTLLRNHHEAPVAIDQLRMESDDEQHCQDYILHSQDSCSLNCGESEIVDKTATHEINFQNRNGKEQFIKENENVLIRSLDCNVNFLERLSSEDILDDESLQEIKAETALLDKNKKLLQILSEYSQDSYDKFVEILQEEKQGHVANLLIGNFEGSQILSLATHERLKRTKRVLVQKIVWSEMLYNKVKSMDILNDTDYENIESKTNFMEKKTVLIDAIMRRSGSDVEKLKQIFQELKQDIITKILSGGHVVAVHLDTSRPADDEKISHLLNLSEINIEDQFEMRGCSILQWQSQVEGGECRSQRRRLKRSSDRMSVSTAIADKDSECSEEKTPKRRPFLDTPYGPLAAQYLDKTRRSMCKLELKLSDGTIRTVAGFLVSIITENRIELKGLLTNHQRLSSKDFEENLECALRCSDNSVMSPVMFSLGSCKYVFTSEEMDATFFQFQQADIDILRNSKVYWLSIESDAGVGDTTFVIQTSEEATTDAGAAVYGDVKEIFRDKNSFWFMEHIADGEPTLMGSPVVSYNGKLVGLHRGACGQDRTGATNAKSISDAILAHFNENVPSIAERRHSRKRKISGAHSSFEAKRSKTLDLHENFLLRSINCSAQLVSRLFSEDVIGKDTQHDLVAQKTPIKRNRRLLQKVSNFSPENYEKFLEILREEKQEHVANLMIGDTTGIQPLPWHKYHVLESNKHTLIKAIKWSDTLLKYLKDMDVLANTDYECLESKTTPLGKKAFLIDALMRRSEEDFEMFKQALVQVEQEDIAEILSTDSVEEPTKSTIRCESSKDMSDVESTVAVLTNLIPDDLKETT